MFHRHALLSFFILPLFAAAGPDQSLPPSPSPPDVSAVIQRYYDHPGSEPWRSQVANLTSKDSEVRRQAAQFLLAVVNRIYDDLPPAKKTPDGRVYQDPAYYYGSFYPAIDDALGAVSPFDPPPEIVPLLAWAIDHDKCVRDSAYDLGRAPGPDADAVLQRLAEQPSPNRTVLVTALQQVAARHLPMIHEKLLTLCNDYRPSVRTAARAAAAATGLQNIPPFDDAHAFDDPHMKNFMAALHPLLPSLAPPDAPFMLVTEWKRYDWKLVPEAKTIRGWAIASSPTQLTLITPFEYTKVFNGHPQGEQPPGPPPDPSATWLPLSISEEIIRVNAIRAAPLQFPDLGDTFSYREPFTNAYATGLYEATLGDWLYLHAEPALAAKALLPAFDYFDSDAELLHSIADASSLTYAQHMLAAFAAARDYPTTLALAAIVARFPPDTTCQSLAQSFLRELPLRTADFITFTLPTPVDWAQFRLNHSREQQIIFLCQHLRLLNVIQHTNPGAPHLDDQQYREPPGLDEDWHIGYALRKTELINPWTELGALNLTRADIPLLTQFLREDWLMPVLSTDRLNHPDGVASTRFTIAEIINTVANAPLCDAAALNEMSPDELAAVINTINHDARQNRAATSPSPPAP